MKVITNFSTYVPSEQGISVAIGCFDGLHRAHQAVIGRTVADRSQGLIPSVFTFHTDCAGLKGAPMLTTNEQRLSSIETMGVEQVFFPTLEEVKNLTPEEFVEQILVGVCNAKRVYCGFNFHFGKGGSGTAQQLRSLCISYGIVVEIIPQILVDGETVSSTRIRRLIGQGEMEEAEALLGHPFGYTLEVCHGRKLGRTIGVPTMNQHLPEGLVQPKFGVYASLISLEKRNYYGVTNVGVKPTVGSDCVVSETWIPCFHGDLYGKMVDVYLLKFLRPERKFPGLEALREQILQDQEQAKAWMEQNFSSQAPIQNF